MELDKITAKDFQPYLKAFMAINFTPEVCLNSELIEITELEGYSPLERLPFSIIFRTKQSKEYYNQGSYTVIHPKLGELCIFLTPLGFDKVGMKYQAIFA